MMAIGCPDCGVVQDLPRLPLGALAICRGCGHRLERTAGRSLPAALGCAFTTLLLLFPANLLPFLSIDLLGAVRVSRLGSGIVVLFDQGWVLLAGLIALLAVLLPFLRFGLLTLVLGALALGRRPPFLGPAFRWATALDLWAMPDVFLLGAVVGYSRVAAYIPVHIGAGGWCFVAAAFFSMITHAALDRRSTWRAIAPEREVPAGARVVSCASCDMVVPLAGAPLRCPRCRARLFARKPDSQVRTAALVAAGFVLYAPANIYAMSRMFWFAGVENHTIFRGIQQLVEARLWPLAVLIFTTSIAIPLLKLVGLSWLLVSIKRPSRRWLLFRTRLHRFIDLIGRWSCIDVFTIAVFAPLLQFGSLVSVHAGRGAVAFMLVVVLTMLASRFFDPRLMWDAAEARA